MATVHMGRHGAGEQRDAADEGRLDPYGNTIVGEVIVNQGKVVRPSQLIASVGRTVSSATRVRHDRVE
jgi:hypothetical protein